MIHSLSHAAPSLTSFKKGSSKKNLYSSFSAVRSKNKRYFLKAFLLGALHQLLCELFNNKIDRYQKNDSTMECYSMDNKIIQFLIHDIIETGEYTLEGIAYHTRIPFDVIFDAAYGNTNQLSITPWARIVDLYIQVRPDVANALGVKLNQLIDNNRAALSLLLNV